MFRRQIYFNHIYTCWKEGTTHSMSHTSAAADDTGVVRLTSTAHVQHKLKPAADMSTIHFCDFNNDFSSSSSCIMLKLLMLKSPHCHKAVMFAQ